MDRMRHDIPPAPRRPDAGARLRDVVLATLAALLVCTMVAVSPAAVPEHRTSAVEDLATIGSDLAVQSIDDTCMDWTSASPC